MSKRKVYSYVTAESLGMVPNSYAAASTNLTLLNNALAARKGTDVGVYISPGRDWFVNGNVIVDSALLFGEGESSTLVMTDGTASPNVSVRLRGYRPMLKWLTVRVDGATVRAGKECVWPESTASGHEIEGVKVMGPAGAGFFVDGAKYGQIRLSTAWQTLSDGFHHKGAAKHCGVEYCTSYMTGDDGFAVVSYQSDGAKCNYIYHYNVQNINPVGGRGLTVVGGDNVTYDTFYVLNARRFGLYVFAESSYSTYGADTVLFKNGSVDGAGINDPNPGYWDGALVGEDNGQLITNVTFINTKITRYGRFKANSFGNVTNLNVAGIS